MMLPKKFTDLQVVGVRYWDDYPTSADDSGLDALKSSNAYYLPNVTTGYTEIGDDGLPMIVDPIDRLGKLCHRISLPVANRLQAGSAVLLTGACCSHAIGVVAAMQQAYGGDTRIGVVWLDAHGDFNTPKTTVSGGLFGMPLAVCAGLALPGWREQGGMKAPIPTDRIILLDARNLDPLERQLIEATAVSWVQTQAAFSDAIRLLANQVDMIYLHIDTDVLDPVYMPTVHLGESNGQSLESIKSIVGQTLDTQKVRVYAVASLRNFGTGREISVASAVDLIQTGLHHWQSLGQFA